MIKQKIREGDYIEIPISVGKFAYGRVAKGKNLAVYDVLSNIRLSIDKISKLPVLFRVEVHNSALDSGKWMVIGNARLSGELAEYSFYRHIPVGSEIAYLYSSETGESIASTKEATDKYEIFAVWEANHVEDRIISHFMGERCVWLDTLER